MDSKKVCYITVIDRVMKYFVYPHINAMLESGCEVTCITHFTDASSLENVRGNTKNIDIEISRTVNPVNLLVNIIKLTRVFKENKYDLIQYTGPSTGLICSISGMIAGIQNRQYCLWGLRYEGFSHGLKRFVFKFLEKVTCKFSSSILLDSENNRQFAIEEGLFTNEKSAVIGLGSACGVDLTVYDIKKKDTYRSEIRNKHNVPEDAFVFGYVGRISKEKGINELFRAFKKLSSKYSNVFLMIVGFQENNNEIDEDLSIWIKEEKRVVFSGREDAPERYYAAFDVFVFPSYREGYGGGCVQAGAFAVPSVVSNIRPLLDAIQNGECGVCFQLGDYADLELKMEMMISDGELRNTLSNKIYCRVVSYFEQSEWMRAYRAHTLSLMKD